MRQASFFGLVTGGSSIASSARTGTRNRRPNLIVGMSPLAAAV
jgi:hypothetical protein